MRARFFQPACPLNIGRFIEARTQLDQSRDLLARVGRVDQGLHDGGIAARAIKGNLDRQHLRILCGLFDQFDDRIEAFVRMMQEHILFAHDLENLAAAGSAGSRAG